MSTIVAGSSSSIIALKTLRNDASVRTKRVQGDVDPTVRSPDPRSAYSLSPPAANALLSFSEISSARTATTSPIDDKIRANTSNSFSINNVKSRDVPLLKMTLHLIRGNPSTDIKEFTSQLPSYLSKQTETRDPSDLSTPPKIHLDDESLVREARNSVLGIYEIATTDEKAREWVGLHMSHSGPYDPNDAKVQAVLNGTAKIIRGPDPAETGYTSHSKAVYGRDPVTGAIEEKGTTTWAEINNKKFIENFEQKNPGFSVHPVYISDDDVALVVYPVASNAKRATSQPIK
ncbi:hypothetical protein [Methylobacterium pseudosasicola]|uniref:Uncharacterized protein n=1 Tax=Methylobacterium pseudosasicola TaxID=582667 RepID=A0A1I4K0L4_9HYPH|nr:hypothetical protein [Methylobacterium pseudosasicola]SFL72254.1 hypothetical protein SAMN05192568_100980 [Methylobacterium pseudosasicola]